MKYPIKTPIKPIVPWVLVVLLTIYSVLVTFFYKETDFRLKALQKYFVPKTTDMILTQSPIPNSTAKPLKNPQQGDSTIEYQIWKDLGGDIKTEIRIINLMDGFAYISEHVIGGGGQWAVVKNTDGKWSYVFISADEIFCSYYQEYNLPKWLLGECSI